MGVIVQLRPNRSKYAGLGMSELLECMLAFQDRRAKQGKLTQNDVLEGIELFNLLAINAETQELRYLTQSYTRHLQQLKKEMNI